MPPKRGRKTQVNDKQGRTIRNAAILAALLSVAGMAYMMVNDKSPWVFALAGIASGYISLNTALKLKDFRENRFAVSPVIAVILMVAITVVLAATVFVLVSDLGNVNRPAPQISWAKDGAGRTLTVSSASDSHLAWADFNVTGCTTVPTSGNVTAGNVISGCSGTVKIVHKPTNALVYETDF